MVTLCMAAVSFIIMDEDCQRYVPRRKNDIVEADSLNKIALSVPTMGRNENA